MPLPRVVQLMPTVCSWTEIEPFLLLVLYRRALCFALCGVVCVVSCYCSGTHPTEGCGPLALEEDSTVGGGRVGRLRLIDIFKDIVLRCKRPM